MSNRFCDIFGQIIVFALRMFAEEYQSGSIFCFPTFFYKSLEQHGFDRVKDYYKDVRNFQLSIALTFSQFSRVNYLRVQCG
jgi:hypothetical protein